MGRARVSCKGLTPASAAAIPPYGRAINSSGGIGQPEELDYEMIVQACLNGNRSRAFHANLPLSAAELAQDAEVCVTSGAAELHIHPRGADGRESLAAVDDALPAVRKKCPGTFVGVSTGSWIENDVSRTRRAIAQWQALPDYASVNLSEPDAPAIMNLLQTRGVGVEAGLATVADTKRFLDISGHTLVWRILIEIAEQELDEALQSVRSIASILNHGGFRRPILLHGIDVTMWPLVRLARQHRWSTRVGLEDGKFRADGTLARNNAELVSDAAAIYRST